jgi:hypothetical protein
MFHSMRFRFAIACVSLFVSLCAAAQAAPVAPNRPVQAPSASRPSAAWLFPIGLTLLAVFRRRTD